MDYSSTNSSQKKRPVALADGKRLFAALEHLANLRDEDASARQFVNRHPEFFGPSMEPYLGPDFVLMQEAGRARTLGPAVRQIWQNGAGEGESRLLMALLLIDDPLEALEVDSPDPVRFPGRLRVDWQRREFSYSPHTQFQKALYELLRNSHRTRVCANPDCPAPFFLANKGTERYCSDACAAVFQRQWKRNWWAKHQAEQKAKSRKSKAKRSK